MNDYINRQAAIDVICNDWCGTSNADCKNPFDPATDDCYHCDGCNDVELIKALPCEDVPHWIPCSKRLPENGRTVLVTDWGETGFGRRYDGRWWNCDDVLKDVSAWMPLPEPWEGGQDGTD